MFLWYDRVVVVLAGAMLGCTTLAIFVGAVGRALGVPLVGAPELAQLFLIWTAVLGADIVMKSGDHIRVDALERLLPEAGRRVLAALTALLIISFLVVLVWFGTRLTAGNWARRMGVIDVSYGWVSLALPVGAAMMLLSYLRRLVVSGLTGALSPDGQGGGPEGEAIGLDTNPLSISPRP